MIQIALYGKGGIGKSTVSANLSAVLAESGKKVLQIGCDPKHDSTRLLTNGNSITTVMEYIRDTLPEDRILGDILFEGYKGVSCVEAGGPEPGVGCAGRGILSMFELLDRLGIHEIPFDLSLYDVLGDVVCGGFAVPLRKEYADAVFLVTSGEYMALYAANNILRGILNFDGSSPRVAGIIHNGRGLEHEDERVDAFARAVELPVVASIPRSELFAEAEKQGKTTLEAFPDSSVATVFRNLSEYISKLVTGSNKLYPSKPLENSEMETLVLGRNLPVIKADHTGSAHVPKARTNGKDIPSIRKNLYSKSVRNKEPLHGCAFAGAVTATSQVNGSLTIIHGPRSCGHIVTHFLSSNVLAARSRHGTNLLCKGEITSTDMGETEFIFGGLDELRSKLEEAASQGWEIVFLVTTCLAGLIGDDLETAVSIVHEEYPGTKIIPVPVDGNLAGDFAQGLVEGWKMISELIDNDVSPEKGLVNIVAEKNLSDNVEVNFQTIESLLGEIGWKVNCRFLNSTTIDSIRQFKKGAINILAKKDDSSQLVRDHLEDRFNASFADMNFPIGFNETSKWLEELSQLSGRENDAQLIIEKEKQIYDAEMACLRPLLQGKKVLINTYSRTIDWLLDVIFDLGMDVLKIGLLHSSAEEGFSSKYAGKVHVEDNYTAQQRDRDILEHRPHLVLSNYPPMFASDGVHYDSIPFCPEVGFRNDIFMAQRWSRLLRLPEIEGWKNDGEVIR
ncbi:nitrogenase component 1 [Methanococcoides seepicolus]|uniref:AAA family ATPase n=1 Tax=Methanococcoides seepicolus TaxID=2828780 RepID=A0A9E5DBN9_9EURY|nr:nitrogenase component 1 [Methanococcoides seepicolus]MCM1987042.1 AAA family ATPase [Methanococcoides seepicolus]